MEMFVIQVLQQDTVRKKTNSMQENIMINAAVDHNRKSAELLHQWHILIEKQSSGFWVTVT